MYFLQNIFFILSDMFFPNKSENNEWVGYTVDKTQCLRSLQMVLKSTLQSKGWLWWIECLAFKDYRNSSNEGWLIRKKRRQHNLKSVLFNLKNKCSKISEDLKLNIDINNRYFTFIMLAANSHYFIRVFSTS